ncbi:MAG: PilZ domain-containing protein [Pseudomonadales bacterium]
MERRTSKRKFTETRVYLHHPEFPATPCTTRDLSADGVFVVTPHARRVRERNVLKMTFAVDLGSVTRLYDFMVTVARVTDEGIGFVIDRSRPARSRAVPRRADTHPTAEVLPLKR